MANMIRKLNLIIKTFGLFIIAENYDRIKPESLFQGKSVSGRRKRYDNKRHTATDPLHLCFRTSFAGRVCEKQIHIDGGGLYPPRKKTQDISHVCDGVRHMDERICLHGRDRIFL